jgi:hypothetical protein
VNGQTYVQFGAGSFSSLDNDRSLGTLICRKYSRHVFLCQLLPEMRPYSFCYLAGSQYSWLLTCRRFEAFNHIETGILARHCYSEFTHSTQILNLTNLIIKPLKLVGP